MISFMVKCDYGCGNEASYKMSNDKMCCSEGYNKCPAIKEKNSKGLKKSYLDGRKVAKYNEYANRRSKEIKKQKMQNYYDSLPFDQKPTAEKCRIVFNEQDGKCKICGISEWLGEKLSLHLDHIDGVNSNNSRENLRYICPNCHSQTRTYTGKNLRGRKHLWYGGKSISDEELYELLMNSKNIRQALLKSGLRATGANYSRCIRILNS